MPYNDSINGDDVMDKINARVASLAVKQLKEMAIKLFTDERDGAEIVFSAVLGELEGRMPEADFVAFCESMP